MASARDLQPADIFAATAAMPRSPAGTERYQRQGQPGPSPPAPAGPQPSAPAPESGETCRCQPHRQRRHSRPGQPALRQGPNQAPGSLPADPQGPGTALPPRVQFAASAPGPASDHKATPAGLIPPALIPSPALDRAEQTDLDSRPRDRHSMRVRASGGYRAQPHLAAITKGDSHGRLRSRLGSCPRPVAVRTSPWPSSGDKQGRESVRLPCGIPGPLSASRDAVAFLGGERR